ncbi:MAG TPA: hypothetical protein VIO33_26695 [Burkholderiaceae bacterium]
MNHLSTSIAGLLAALAMTTAAEAQQQQQTEHPLGDHPAVIVKRNWSQRPIDYASTFYPHPAWLYLTSEPVPGAADAPLVASVDRSRRNAPAAPALTGAPAASAK